MANAVTWWSSDSSSNGVIRARGRTSDIVIPIATPVAESPTATELSRQAPTVRARKTTFRLGAKTEEKSSLAIFVLIGLAVGLFAFLMMSFCLPDPAEAIAARAAKKEQQLAMTPAPTATPDPVPMAMAAPVAVPAMDDIALLTPAPSTVLTAKTPHAHRRASKTKKAILAAAQ